MADLGPEEPASIGLRARARRLRRERQAPVGLGDEQSQAYFNAKRFRSSRRKPAARKPTTATSKKRTRKREASEEDKDEEEQEQKPEEAEDEEDDKLVLPPQGEMLAALQRVDADEALLRDGVASRRFPRFDHCFGLWKSELRAGNSLLLSGVGSKLSLLQDFAAQALTDGYVVQVHGYLPTVSMRHLCSYLRHDALRLKADTCNRSLIRQCQEIVRQTTPSDTHSRSTRESVVYLLVHAIDGAALRTPELQTCLSWLASSPRIHLVASIEHINGCAMWKETDALRFQWLAHSVHSLRAYSSEIELRIVKRARVGDLAASSGVKFILQSLTPTDVGTLQEVARQQLAGRPNGKAAAGSRRPRQAAGAKAVVYQSVFDACRKKLLHLSVQSMKNSVKCLENHGLLRLVRAQDGELLEIPLAEDVIKSEVLHIAEDADKKS